MLIPQCLGILEESFNDDEMGQVFGVFGPLMALAALAAPMFGGAGLVRPW